MKRYFAPGIILALLCVLAAGCNRDPKARREKFLQSAREFSAKGEHSKALLQYQNAYKITKDAETLFLIAKEHEAQRQFAEAFKALNSAVRVDPNHRGARLRLGDIYVELRRYQDALEQVQALLEKNPKDVDALLVAASAYNRDGKFDQARGALDSVLSADPKNVRALKEMAAVRFLNGDTPGGEALLQQVADLGGRKLEATLPLIELYLRSKRPAEAVALCEEAVQKEPASLDALTKLAQVYLLAGKVSSAEETFRRVKALPNAGVRGKAALGDFYLTIGQLEKARQEFDALHKAEPNELSYSRQLALVLLYLGKDQEADQVLEALLKSNQDTYGLIYRAQVRVRQNRLEDALADLNVAVRQEPTLPMVHFQMAQVFAVQGNITRARASLGDALKYDPKMTPARVALARLNLRTGSPEQAKAEALRLIRANPQSLTSYLLHASSLLASKDYAGAERELKVLQGAVSKEDKGAQAGVLVGLARVQAGRGNYAAGRDYLQEAMKGLSPTSPAYTALVGEVVQSYIYESKLPRARGLLEERLAEQPDNADYLLMLAQVHMAEKEPAKAEAALQKLLAKHPGSLEGGLNMALVRARQGRMAEGLQLLNGLAAKHPNDARVRTTAASVAIQAGQPEQAIREYEAAQRLGASDLNTLNNLAWLYANSPQGNIDMALKLAQQAREREPDSPEIAHTLAFVMMKKGSYVTAASLLQECLKQRPKNQTYLYHMGLAQLGKNDKGEARRYFEQALKGGRDFPGAADAATQLENIITK